MTLQQHQNQITRRGDVLKYEDNSGNLLIKAFLLNSDININKWGINKDYIDEPLKRTAINKPLVLTENFNHPVPPSDYKVGDSEYYDDDSNPNNVVKVNDIIEHWLEYQEPFRVGNIIDIVKKGSAYYGIIEVTDEFTKNAFKNNDLPLFVSPGIAQLDPFEDPSNITKWTFIHLAIVANPAYTIKKALITGQCQDEKDKCLLQLRNASVAENRKQKKLDCGFCRQQALRKYARTVKNLPGVLHWAATYDDFMNSSVVSKNPVVRIENILTADENEQNNNQNQPEPTTNYEANRQNNVDNKDNDDKRQQPNPDTSNEQPAGKTATGEEQTKANSKQTETKVITTETETTNDKEKDVKKTADTSKCIQIISQLGVQDPAQAEQVCQMLMQSFVDSYNQPNQTKSMGPPTSGQVGSTVVDELNKTIAKQAATIEKLNDDLKLTKKNDKSDTQRIAELEEQIKSLNNTIKEKELESYLVAKIADEKARSDKVKRFATLGLTIDDLKEVYETPIKKVAEVVEQETKQPATGKVKLQTASTNEEQSNTEGNKIRDANKRLVSSFRQNDGVY